ncbi:alpha/beta hydrolase [Phenylobacterium sp.]|uniref:alpha/beta hydrolase n=1 Tax=Phenylobacterium sp. TaxID=1871053 RepID=UPI00286B2FAA|nr:alpha/beta hydrolase [Phenylobacterium sp.]
MDDAGLIEIAREVPAKRLKTPSTVSPQLQRSISGLAAAAAAGGGLPQGWAPQSVAEWKTVIAQMDAQALAMAPALAALYPHTCELGQIAGVTVREITPATLDPAKSGRRLVHFHGGGYALNGGEASTGEAVLGAHHSGMKVISVDYRMPPDHPFPAAVDDAVAVWRALTAERSASAMGVFGTSAGGGLTLALALKLKDLGETLPGALATGTPWTDLTGASDSYQVNAAVDGVFSNFDGFAAGMAALYAGEAGVTHPLVSPIFGDFAGFPPTIFTTGTRDILLSDTVRAYRAMRAAGVTAQLEVHEAMSHAEYIYAFDSPESAVAFGDIARFFDEHLSN